MSDLDTFLDDIETHRAATDKMRKLDPGGKWDLAPIWCAPKDGKPSRPVVWWKPSAAEWERRSLIFHEKQAEEAKRFAEQTDERIRQEKQSAGSKEIETSFGADAGTPAKKESRSGQHKFDVTVV